MNNQQKLAALTFRILGTCWAGLVAFFMAMYAVESALGVAVKHYPTHTLIANVAYIVLGLALIIFSKPLGRLVGRGLD